MRGVLSEAVLFTEYAVLSTQQICRHARFKAIFNATSSRANDVATYRLAPACPRRMVSIRLPIAGCSGWLLECAELVSSVGGLRLRRRISRPVCARADVVGRMACAQSLPVAVFACAMLWMRPLRRWFRAADHHGIGATAGWCVARACCADVAAAVSAVARSCYTGRRM
jgi:hypothetical protein